MVEAVLFVSILVKLRQHFNLSPVVGASRLLSFSKDGAWASMLIFGKRGFALLDPERGLLRRRIGSCDLTGHGTSSIEALKF